MSNSMSSELYDAFTEWHMTCIAYEQSLENAFAAGFASTFKGEAFQDVYNMLLYVNHALETDSLTIEHSIAVKNILDKYSQ